MNWKAGDKGVSLKSNIIYEIDSCVDEDIAIGKILKWADGSLCEKSMTTYVALKNLKPLKSKSHPLTDIFK